MGFYGHALKAAFGQAVGANPIVSLLSDVKCLAATSFFAVFGAVIALMKVRQDTQLSNKVRVL